MRIGVVFPQTEIGADAGASDVSINTIGSVDQHLEVLTTAAEIAREFSR